VWHVKRHALFQHGREIFPGPHIKQSQIKSWVVCRLVQQPSGAFIARHSNHAIVDFTWSRAC
jgi:hypothetical protein